VEKLDLKARKKITSLRHIAWGMKESACMELSIVAEEHWSDGALDADLRLVDLRTRRRVMEDVHVSLQVYCSTVAQSCHCNFIGTSHILLDMLQVVRNSVLSPFLS
jgi:hypothetical protein